MNLKNKVAIVTGGGSGIGKAIAVVLAKDGATVVIADIDVESGEKVAKSIKEANGQALFIKTDTSNVSDCKAVVDKTISEFGRLDIAINNAGIGGEAAITGEYEIESWDKVIGINLSGVFYGMKYQLSAMQDNEGDSVIINMASVLGQVGTARSSAYVAAKHGVVGLTKAAAIEYAHKGIRVNAVGPGYVETPLLTENLSDEQLAGIKKLHPIGRLGKPDEVAQLVLWLCSDHSSFVTGSYYNVDGGYLAQ